MAHKIEENDIQEGTTMAWHGLTRVNPKLSLENLWLNSWDVQPVSLIAAISELDEKKENKKTDYRVLVCSDNGKIIGKPYNVDTYGLISNKMFLELIRDSLSGTKHKVASAGSIMNRDRVFVSIGLDELKKFEIKGRPFESFLNFGSSFDMGVPFFANTSNICTVCYNTWTANLHHKGKAVDCRVKHTPGALLKLENLPEIVDAAVGVQFEFNQALQSLSKEKTDKTGATEIFTGYLVRESAEKIKTLKPEDRISTRKVNMIGRLTELFNGGNGPRDPGGKGNRGESLLDVFQAVTDFYSHESAGENRQKQFESSEFGKGARDKGEFYSMITNEENRVKTREHGKEILSLVTL